MLHNNCNDQIKNVIKYSCCHQRHYGSLRCRDLLCDRKHLRYCQHKGQGCILYQCDHFVGHCRKHPLDDLRQNNPEKRLNAAVS